MKVALASTIATAFRVPPVGAKAERRRPLVLCYHRIVEDFNLAARHDMPSMLTSAGMFEQHLDWFGRFFRFVSLDEIADRARSGLPFAEPVAAVTFDDGYRDVYQHAFPRLRARGIPAAVFVVTDLIGTAGWQRHDKLYYLLGRAFSLWSNPRLELLQTLERLGIVSARVGAVRVPARDVFATVATILPVLSHDELARVIVELESLVGEPSFEAPALLTWPMLREMHAAGVTIGSHTRTHVSLPMEPADSVREQLAGSKRALEDQLGAPVRHFAYPGGQFTREVVERVAGAGYAGAYTACPHGDLSQPAFTIERLLLSEGSSVDADGRLSPYVLGCQAYDLWPPARRCERTH